MGLPYGCTSAVNEIFLTKFFGEDLKYTGKLTKNLEECKQIVFPKREDTGAYFILSSIPGDCTACSLHAEVIHTKNLHKVFEIVQSYMSINGRISCFFSLKKHKVEVQETIDTIKNFTIAGLHVQKSNRNPMIETYMISGILKVTNPYIKDYTNCEISNLPPKDYNHNDTTEYEKINSEFKF